MGAREGGNLSVARFEGGDEAGGGAGTVFVSAMQMSFSSELLTHLHEEQSEAKPHFNRINVLLLQAMLEPGYTHGTEEHDNTRSLRALHGLVLRPNISESSKQGATDTNTGSM